MQATPPTNDPHPLLVHASVEDLHQLVSRLRADGDPLPPRVAWQAGYALHLHGSFSEAAEVYASADETDADPIGRALLRSGEAATAWARGDAEASRQLADTALTLATECDDQRALGYAWVAQALIAALEGDRDANQRAYQRALDHASRGHDQHLMTRIHNNLGSLMNEEGRHREALTHLTAAVSLAEEIGHLPLLALTTFNWAEATLRLGLLDEARTAFDDAHRIWQDLGSPLIAIAALGEAETHRIRGAAAQAAAHYREAIELGQAHDNQQAVIPAIAGLARVTVLDDPKGAERLLDEAMDRPAALGHVAVELAAGWVALCRGRHERAAELGRRAESEAGHRRDSRGLAEALELLALCEDGPQARGRLDEAAMIWERTESALDQACNLVLRARVDGDREGEEHERARLRALGVREGHVRIAGPLMAIGDPEPPAVKIHLLGGFTVQVDGRAVASSQWQSRKARELVKVLADRAGRPVTREQLCDLLWSGADSTTRNRLSVLLSTVRKLLDPRRQHAADHFMYSDRDVVRLDLAHVVVDAADFESRARYALDRAAADAPDALGLLEDAAERYSGTYLEEDPDLPWAEPTREALRSTYRQVQWEIAELLSRPPHSHRAVPWLVGMLADDPYDERAHGRLVHLLTTDGRHGEARRYYRYYCERMAELNVEPVALADLR